MPVGQAAQTKGGCLGHPEPEGKEGALSKQVVNRLKTTFPSKIDRTASGFDVEHPDRLELLVQRMKAPQGAAVSL